MSSRTLFNRDFVLLWQGQLVSQVGNQAYLVAQMFWTMQATGSAGLMGLLLMSAVLPGVLLGPFAGTFADRHSRKAIIVASDLLRGGTVLLLAVLLFTKPEETGTVVVVLFGVGICSGIIGAAFNPAITAAIPDLVPAKQLQAANSLSQFSAQGAAFLGQAVGGVAFRLLGAPLLFLVDGISYVLSALSESWIRLPQRHVESPPSHRRWDSVRSYLSDTAVGFRWFWGWKAMRTFVLTATGVNFLFAPVLVLLPFYVTDVLGRDADWYGFLLSSISLGSLVGLMIAGSFRLKGKARARALTGAFLAVTSLLAVLGLVQHPVAALVVTFTIGIFASIINIFVVTLVQVATPAEMRGRVMGLVLSLGGAASPLGMAAGGILADATGLRVPATFVTIGLLATALVLAGSSRSGFQEFLATSATAEH